VTKGPISGQKNALLHHFCGKTHIFILKHQINTMDLFKKLTDMASDALESATENLGDLKDAAMEKASEIAGSETVTNLKATASEYYDKAQDAAGEAAESAKEHAGEALESGKGFWDKAKAFAEEKTAVVKDMLDVDDAPKA
jgi:ElaB/YqjD/DUF883 family membrane-anchored ribosome-binding protein